MWSKLWVGLVGLAAFASASHAATALYDFRNLAADGNANANADAASLVFTKPGLVLSITAYSGPPNVSKNVIQTSGTGLGVKGGDSDQTIDHKEFLDLTFSSNVTIETIQFTDFVSGPGNSGDAANVQLISPNTGLIFSGAIPGTSPSTVDVTGVPVANRLGLIFEFATNMGNDNYALGGICVTYSYTDTRPPSVPVPASIYGGVALLSLLACSRKVRHAFA